MGRNQRAFAIPMLCTLVGVILAITLQMLNDAEIIVNELLVGTIVLRDVQAIVILSWMFIGVMLAAIQR